MNERPNHRLKLRHIRRLPELVLRLRRPRLRPHQDIPTLRHRRTNRRLPQTPILRRRQQQTRKPRMQRKRRHLPSQIRQPLTLIQRPQRMQHILRPLQRRLRRHLKPINRQPIPPTTHRRLLQRQQRLRKIQPVHLRHLTLRPVPMLPLRPKPHRNPRPQSPSTPRPLLSRRP